MSGVNEAEPGDIYVDTAGKLWRIKSVYREPTVEAEEVEGTLFDPDTPIPQGSVHLMQAQAPLQNAQWRPRARIDKQKKSGGAHGAMWQGWKRIWRSEP